MPKIVVLDGYTENPGDLSWEGLAALGELTVHQRTPADSIVERIGDADIVYTNKTPIGRDVLEACPSVRFIGVLATGYNVVDVAAAREKGIPVCNVPVYGTAAVAQFTFALLLEVCHHVGHHAARVRDGEWLRRGDFCFWDKPLLELEGRVMGLIGYGRIGKAVARIARAFGMEALYADPSAEGNEDAQPVSMEELLARADVVSLHCPLTADNQGIIGREALARMKQGAILLNTSRGPLVEEMAVRKALEEGRLGYYAADVASIEPIQPDNPLLDAPNCLITPHIAWAPKASRQRLMDVAVENLAAYLGGTPINVVN